MSDPVIPTVDLDLWSYESLVEHRSVEEEEMSPSMGADSECVLAAEAARLDSPCCGFSSRVNSVNRERLALLNLALSEQFRSNLLINILLFRNFFPVLCFFFIFVDQHVNCPVVEEGKLIFVCSATAFVGNLVSGYSLSLKTRVMLRAYGRFVCLEGFSCCLQTALIWPL